MAVNNKVSLVAVSTLLVTTLLLGQLTETFACQTGPVDDREREHCQGYAVRCNSTALKQVPTSFPKYHNHTQLCVLDLSQNQIAVIKNHSFVHVSGITILLLFENCIQRIDSDAFVKLTKLKYLNLTSNRLHNPELSFGDGVFSPLINLTYINLKNNSITSYDELQSYLQPLKKLKKLFISGCNGCRFGEGFANLTKLQFVSLAGTGLDTCNMPVLTNETFTHISHVSELYLSSCNISTVEAAAFQPLKTIYFLDISYNENLKFEGMKNVLEGLINSSIGVINFNHIHEYFERGLVLQYQHIEPIKYLRNLSLLFLDLNKIEIIEENVFDIIPHSVKRIGMAGNRLTNGKYTAKFYTMDYLKSLDLSRQHLTFDPFFYQHFEQTSLDMAHAQQTASIESDFWSFNNYTYWKSNCISCKFHCPESVICLCIPPKLENLTWTKSFLDLKIHNIKLCKPSSLTRLDASSNLISEWTGPVKGVETVEVLNLADNYCQKLSTLFFDNFYKLHTLNVSFNFLGPVFSQFSEGHGDYFKNLKSLEILDLSENRITTLPSNIFLNLTSLKRLHLSKNMLNKWTSTLRSNYLRLLDLSENKLETLPESLRNYLDKMSTLSVPKLKVDISRNPFQCNCDTRPFLQWLSETRVDILSSGLECYLQNGKRVILSKPDVIVDTIKRLNQECFPTASIVVSICMFIFGVAVCIIVYRCRWKLRHWYYSKFKRHSYKGYDRLFDRDAFISYASTECSFIKRFLIPALEEQRGLKVWVADRDSVPGASVAENIVHAINFSKRTVLLLSKGHFKESWGNYEMNMARVESIESQRKLFIIVLMDDIVAKEFPLDYLRLLQTESSVEYPSKPQDRNAFWDSICAEIQRE